MLRSELPPSPDRTFVTGLVTGLVAAGVLVHVWFAVLLAPLRDTYAELGGKSVSDVVPCLTNLVIHPAWLWGVPLAGTALVIALITRRPRRLGPYVACAMLLASTLVVTWVMSQSPLGALADNIRSDVQIQLDPIAP